MEGVSLKYLWKPAIDICTTSLELYQANYPETLGKCFVINAPPYVPIMFSVVKPFLDEYTRSKIHFLGRNWKEELLKHIAPDQLPVHWGGTRTGPDGDPYCKSHFCNGGPVPESLYLKNNSENIDLSQFTRISVSPAASTTLEFQVETPGSILSWNFWTDDNDIAFGVYRRTTSSGLRQKKEDMEEVVATCRVNSHLVPESGTVVCDLPGTYVVCFDNTYSWVTAKKVFYLIQVLTPDTDLEQIVSEITAF
jgi:hypothetical protein